MLHLTMNKGATGIVTRLAFASVNVELFLEGAASSVSMAVIAIEEPPARSASSSTPLMLAQSRSEAALPRLPFESSPASASGGKPARNSASQT